MEKEKIDVYLDAGDLHSATFAQKFFNSIKIRTLVSPGNADWNFKFKSKNVDAVNFGLFKHKGYHFLVAGNTFPTDFVTEALALTKDVPPEKLIFLSHYPPHGVLDLMWNGVNMGVPQFRMFDEIKQPILHIFGHIHEARGVERVKGTTLVNCSVAGNGKSYIIDLPKLEIFEVDL